MNRDRLTVVLIVLGVLAVAAYDQAVWAGLIR